MKRPYLMFAILIVAIFFGLLYFSQRQTGMVIVSELAASNGYIDVTSVEAKMLVDANSDLIIIDVSPFYDEGHLPGAMTAFYGDGSFEKLISHLNPDSVYLVYCYFDGPSIESSKKMVDAGFSNVYRLEDHYAGWVSEGYSIEK